MRKEKENEKRESEEEKRETIGKEIMCKEREGVERKREREREGGRERCSR